MTEFGRGGRESKIEFWVEPPLPLSADIFADLRPAMRLHARFGCWICLIGPMPCEILRDRWLKEKEIKEE